MLRGLRGLRGLRDDCGLRDDLGLLGRRSCATSDDGTITAVVLVVIFALASVCLAALSIAGLEQARWRAQTSADLAALAAASQGDCRAAEEVAQRNRSTLEKCRLPSLVDPRVTVMVSTRVRQQSMPMSDLWPGASVTAVARAGY